MRVGHWTDPEARTGCTVVLLPEGTVASAEVRGGAPATRELVALEPGRTVERLDALVLTGGSAFGLASADGVMRWCEERGLGFPTGAGPVPIVVGLGLFDLLEGDGSVRPGPDAGYAACVAATAGEVPLGRVGAGAGCLVRKWEGRDQARPAGLGAAVFRDGDLVVAALIAVNAVGDRPVVGDLRLPVPPTQGFAAAGDDTDENDADEEDDEDDAAAAGDDEFAAVADAPAAAAVAGEGTSTTIGIIVTNARLTKLDCHLAAQSGHDGLARALDPVHTAGDGDALVVAATNRIEAPLGAVRALATYAVESAVLDGIQRGSAPA